MTVFTAQLGQEHQVGYLRIRSLGRDLSFLRFSFIHSKSFVSSHNSCQ